MRLQFEPNQDYQLEAIQSAMGIFEGQFLELDDLSVKINGGNQTSLVNDIIVGNKLLVNDEQIAANTRTIQSRNKLDLSETVGGEIMIPTVTPAVSSGGTLKNGRNFTVEMETGTGKTYVYLRTIHELYQTYGFKKFIIVVPSIAVKEGVVKNLQITREHFATIYSNPKMDCYVWDPKKRGQMRAFATNSSLQILVINIDSFAKITKSEEETSRKQNIIYQESDWGKPIEYIQATNPIVIVDEPQNMETEVRKQAIEQLNPLCTLRYSATHKNPYNMVYKLDPVQAYDRGLVKRIEVDSVLSDGGYNGAYMQLLKLERQGKSGLVAHVEVDKDDARGLQRQVYKLEPGDDLHELTGREVYRGFTLDRIDARDNLIEFANGKTLTLGQKDEELQNEIAKYQIRRTIMNHFEKEQRLKDRGIKVLTLFFIDRVANYREYDENGASKGKFARWFEEIYDEIQRMPKFAGVLEFEAEAVHNGYFSRDKDGSWKDTKGETAADDDTYELIMKDKERLLDPNIPLRFIFSHSALREGWDNPNVFQICTLNETSSEIKKRQEIGRGLRLPVDQNGLRVRDESINILTVIANESYEDFARKLQTEIEEETGVSFASRIKSKQERIAIHARKGFELDEDFQALWERIKTKTRYHVTFSSDELIKQTAEQLSEVQIKRPRLTSTRASIEMNESGVAAVMRDESRANLSDAANMIVIPDVLGKIQAHTKLTRPTIFQILKSANMIEPILINPQQVIDETTKAIKQTMQKLMVDGIKYERIEGAEWEMRRFDDKELEGYLYSEAEKRGAMKVTNLDKTIYDHVLVDSRMEHSFARELENRSDIRFYFKLPSWFKIDTPLGGYNPDWALVFEHSEKVYFVAETKGSADRHDEHLTESELLKIKCGEAHFDQLPGVTFRGPYSTVSQVVEEETYGEKGIPNI